MGCIYSNNKGDNKSIQVANQKLISKDIKEPSIFLEFEKWRLEIPFSL